MAKDRLRSSWGLVALWLAVYGLLFAVGAEAGGFVAAESFHSPTLGRRWSYTMYFPEGYEERSAGGRSYPILYLLHGNGGDEMNWVQLGDLRATMDSLIEGKEIPALVVAMPAAGSSWYVDGTEKMERAFWHDFMPHVERRYSIRRKRRARLVGGLSMGGYGALRFSLRRPDIFCGAALFSPAIYVPLPPMNSSARSVGVFGRKRFSPARWRQCNWPQLLPAYRRQGQRVAMYISSGDDDAFFIHRPAVQLYDELRALKQPAELRIRNGGHEWALWRDELAPALRYLGSFLEPGSK